MTHTGAYKKAWDQTAPTNDSHRCIQKSLGSDSSYKWLRQVHTKKPGIRQLLQMAQTGAYKKAWDQTAPTNDSHRCIQKSLGSDSSYKWLTQVHTKKPGIRQLLQMTHTGAYKKAWDQTAPTNDSHRCIQNSLGSDSSYKWLTQVHTKKPGIRQLLQMAQTGAYKIAWDQTAPTNGSDRCIQNSLGADSSYKEAVWSGAKDCFSGKWFIDNYKMDLSRVSF